ncbi:MAG: integrase, partial [Rhodospirillales bacterium]|nr:integrase [Rhodospirillales bacterium]
DLSPLWGRALEILGAARALNDGGPHVFPMRSRRPISASTLVKALQNLRVAAVPQGFRSSFRDWTAERTNHPREVIEAALANVVQNKVEAAYARSDLFERRRRLMDEWAAYLGEECGQVVTLPATTKIS